MADGFVRFDFRWVVVVMHNIKVQFSLVRFFC